MLSAANIVFKIYVLIYYTYKIKIAQMNSYDRNYRTENIIVTICPSKDECTFIFPLLLFITLVVFKFFFFLQFALCCAQSLFMSLCSNLFLIVLRGPFEVPWIKSWSFICCTFSLISDVVFLLNF